MEDARPGLTDVDAGPGPGRAPVEMPVGIGRLVVAEAPAVLFAIGLGSCVGVVLHDLRARIGALAHVFLPEAPAAAERRGDAPGKFADLAVPAMVERLLYGGSAKYRLQAKLVGGARVLVAPATVDGAQDVGSRNVEMARKVLERMRIPIVGEAVGGDVGRTLRYDVTTGAVEISSLGKSVCEI